jgi:hypothetical protein
MEQEPLKRGDTETIHKKIRQFKEYLGDDDNTNKLKIMRLDIIKMYLNDKTMLSWDRSCNFIIW